MALVSVVNGIPGDPAPLGGRRGLPAWPAAPGASGGDRTSDRERAPGVVPARRSIRPVAALTVPAVTAVAVIGTAALLRRRYLRWGATNDEQHRSLAGDELLPAADQSTTRAITITAAADDIWPWIAQLGQGRGGFYSYDWLENLVVRADFHNADRIVPEWQQITVGGEVRLAPEVALKVVGLEPGRALVLRGSVPMGQAAPPYDFTWAFVLLPQPDGTTRLVVRERYEYTHRWAALIVQPAQLVSCLMSPKMLRGIKTRAEHAPNGAVRTPPLPLPTDLNVALPIRSPADR